MVDSQAQDLHTNIVSPSGHEHHSVHVCHKCGWPFPNPHPSAKHRRAHKRVCGTIEGYKLTESEQDTHLTVSDDEQENLSDNDRRTPSPKSEKKVSGSGEMGERLNISEADVFSDAKTDFSDTVDSPGPGNEEHFASARELVTNLQKTEEVAFSPHQTMETNANSDMVLPARKSVDANQMQNVEVLDDVSKLETARSSDHHLSDPVLDFSVNDIANAGTKEVTVGLTDGRDGPENDSSPVVSNVWKNASKEDMETNAGESAIQSSMPLSEKDKVTSGSEGNNLLQQLSVTQDLSCRTPKKPSETEFILEEICNKDSNSVPECGNIESKEGQSEGFGLTRSQSNSSFVVIAVEPVDSFVNKYQVREYTAQETHCTDLVSEGKENVHMLSVPDNIPIEDQAETLLKDYKDHKMLKSDLPVKLHFNEAVVNIEGHAKDSISNDCYSSFKSNDSGINTDVSKDRCALLADDLNGDQVTKPMAVDDTEEKEADSSGSKIVDAENLGGDEPKAPSDAKSNEAKNIESTGPLEEQGPPMAANLPVVKEAETKILDDENLELDFEEAPSDASGKVKNTETAGYLEEQEPPMAINVLVEKEADLYELKITSPKNLGIHEAEALPHCRTGDGEMNKSNPFVLSEESGPHNLQNEMPNKILRDSSSIVLDVNPVVHAPTTCTPEGGNVNNCKMDVSQMLDIPKIDSTEGAAKDYFILNTNLINESVVDQLTNSSGVDNIADNEEAEIGHPGTAGYKSTKTGEGATMECHAIEMKTIGGTIMRKPQDSGDEIIEAGGNLKETPLPNLEGLPDTSAVGVNASQSDDVKDIHSSVLNIQGKAKDIQEDVKDLEICTEDKLPYAGVGSMISDSAPGTGSELFQKILEKPSIKEPRDLHGGESSDQNSMAVNQAKEFGGGIAGVSSQSCNEETENRQQLGASPIDVLVDSSSQGDSLEGNWGSVSALSTQSDALAIVDAEVLRSAGSQVATEAEKGDLRKPRNALGAHVPDKLDLFEPPSFMTLVEPPERRVQKPTSSEIRVSAKQQSSFVSPQEGWFPSLTNVTNESPGRKRNEEIIAKVTNWSSGKQHTTLKSFLDESNGDPKPKLQKSRQPPVHVAAISENSLKDNGSSSTTVNPVAGTAQPKDWNSPARYPTEKRKAKSKPYWAPFVCCSSVN
ncbi:hypothetical protein RJ641_004742 [Dillenia turbinata]|uniref:C2H2-type domain-containing protein n=1 Tax=Dillenia turbinata TaxID=194707 RepID=A0AAN8ZEC6_9MAGN